jgi:hypothetical protein
MVVVSILPLVALRFAIEPVRPKYAVLSDIVEREAVFPSVVVSLCFHFCSPLLLGYVAAKFRKTFRDHIAYLATREIAVYSRVKPTHIAYIGVQVLDIAVRIGMFVRPNIAFGDIYIHAHIAVTAPVYLVDRLSNSPIRDFY